MTPWNKPGAKFVTTNVRLPESLSFELKMRAAHQRTSLAAVIRDRIRTSLMGKEAISP